MTVSSLPTKRNVDDQLERYFLLEQKKKDQLKHKGKKSIVLYTKTLVRMLKAWFHFFFFRTLEKKKKHSFEAPLRQHKYTHCNPQIVRPISKHTHTFKGKGREYY